MKKKVVLGLLIFLGVLFICGGVYLFKTKIDNKGGSENSTLNAMMDMEENYGTVLENANLYMKPDLNSTILYELNAEADIIILSDNEYKDESGNVFIKVLYLDNDNYYSGYLEKVKVEGSEEEDGSGAQEDTPPAQQAQNYVVTFNSNGGTSIAKQQVKAGEKVVKPKDPTRTGYTFGGWILGNAAYNFDAAVNSNIVLKAKWVVRKKYLVRFYFGDGYSTLYKDIYVYAGDKVPKPGTDPVKVGNKFVGWYLDGKAYNFNTAVNKNMTLKATFKYNFSNLDTCTKTGVSINTGENSNFKLYRCLADYGFDYAAHGKNVTYNARSGQGFAVTKDYAYINYPIFGAWSQSNPGRTPAIFQNFTHRINKKTGEVTTSWIKFGGHGQSFDVTVESGKDLLYYNAYPYVDTALVGGTTWYGAFYKGIAYSTFNPSQYMVPSAFAFNDNGKVVAHNTGSAYNISAIEAANKKSNLYNPDVAIDESNNTLALVSSRKVLIYNLKKLKSNSSDALIRTVNFSGATPKQGVELIGNSLYIWNENKVKDTNVGLFKVDVYNVSPANNGKTVKPYLSAKINLSSYYSKIGKNLSDYYAMLEKLYAAKGDAGRQKYSKTKKEYYANQYLEYCEAEGMSIYNGKVYLLTMCRQTAPEYSKGDVYQLVWK